MRESPACCGRDDEAGELMDEALAILRRDLRSAVELAERDIGRAWALYAFAVRLKNSLALWREIDAVAGHAVVNPSGEGG